MLAAHIKAHVLRISSTNALSTDLIQAFYSITWITPGPFCWTPRTSHLDHWKYGFSPTIINSIGNTIQQPQLN